MEQVAIDVLKPILEQWPTVTVLLVVGFAIWKAYQHCQTVLVEQLKWMRSQLEKEWLDRTK